MVPMRAKERAEGLYPVLSTAVAKWQPAEPWGRVARGGELQREGKRAVKGWGATRGVLGRQEVAGSRPRAVGGTVQRRRQSKQTGRLEVGERGPVCNFCNFQGPYCKIDVTFKPGVK